MIDFEEAYYYDYRGGQKRFQIPNGDKSHFMAVCAEHEQLTTEEILVDFAYLVSHGYDLVTAVKKFMEEHPDYEDYVSMAFCKYMEYLHGDDSYIRILRLDGVITVEELVEACSKEVKQRYGTKVFYDLKGNDYIGPCLKEAPVWDCNRIFGLKKWTKRTLAKFLLLTTEEMLQKVEELSAKNAE